MNSEHVDFFQVLKGKIQLFMSCAGFDSNSAMKELIVLTNKDRARKDSDRANTNNFIDNTMARHISDT
jgi:hypothetical protein